MANGQKSQNERLPPFQELKFKPFFGLKHSLGGLKGHTKFHPKQSDVAKVVLGYTKWETDGQIANYRTIPRKRKIYDKNR